MADSKFITLMLLIILINITILSLCNKIPFKKNEGISIESNGRAIRDPFASALKTYLERKGISSNSRVAIEVTSSDQKVNIVLSIAKNYITQIKFPLHTNSAPKDHFQRESPTSDSAMNIATENITPTIAARQAITLSPRTITEPKVTNLRGRNKRESPKDLDMTFKQKMTISSPNTTITKQSKGETTSFQQTIEETSAISPQTTLIKEISTLSGRVVGEEPTQVPQQTLLEIITATDQADKGVIKDLNESNKPTTPIQAKYRVSRDVTKPAQIETVMEVTTTAGQHTTILSTDSDTSNRQKTLILEEYGVIREAKTAQQTNQEQEVTTPRGQLVKEHSTSDLHHLNEENTTIPSIDKTISEVRTAPQTNMGQEVVSQNGQVVSELSISGLNNSNIQKTTAPYTNLKQEITTSGRVAREVENTPKNNIIRKVRMSNGHFLRESSSLNSMNVKDHEKIISKEEGIAERFIRETFSAFNDELKEVKLQGGKRITNLNDDPTFPPPTDPEGTDF